MAEFLANAVQQVGLNQPVIFTASIPCTRRLVLHEDETGNFILRAPNNGTCFARYSVTFTANIAIPTGGTVGAIATAITVNGEQRPTSRAIFTPAAVDTYGNVTSTAIITVPAGCCFNLAVRYVDGTNELNTTTTAINVQDANLVITRIA